MFNTKPLDWALVNFKCGMSQDRLRQTPDDDISLVLSRDDKRSLKTLSAVYVVANDANALVKIGYADNLKIRMSGLNCGSPVDLRLVHFLYFVDCFIAKTVEGGVHKALAAHRRKGEWFGVTPEQAGEAIAQTVNSRKLRWFTEEERRRLGKFVRDSYVRYEERERFFGT